VLVTGASRGIGQETAIQYARAGASIVLVARTEESLTGTMDLIVSAAPGAEVLALAADVREAKAAEAAVQRVLERFGKLDVLIANAGSISVLGKREKGLDFPCSCKMIDLVSPSVLDEKDPDAWWKALRLTFAGHSILFGAVGLLPKCFPPRCRNLTCHFCRYQRCRTCPQEDTRLRRRTLFRRGAASDSGKQRCEHLEACRESPHRVCRAR